MESKKLRVLALTGMLAAVGYVLQLFEFPLLPAAPFLKFDFGDVAVVVAGSMFGPGAAVLTAIVKGLLWALIGRGGNGLVGAGMNTIAVIVFALPLVLGARSQGPVSYTHLRAHETRHDVVCRLLLEKKNKLP